MMKNSIYFLIIALLTVWSCRGEDDTVQQIDQILNIYVKDSNDKDLINPKIQGAYTTVQFFDLLADTDLKPVSSWSFQKDKDTVNYIDYTAGATRLLSDSVGLDSKTYYSEMLVRFSKKENNQTIIDDDTIKIEYTWSPDSFQVSKMWHANHLVFTKEQGKANIVKLVK